MKLQIFLFAALVPLSAAVRGAKGAEPALQANENVAGITKKKKVSTCKKPFVCKEKPTECKKSKCVCRKGKSKWICIQSPKSELANKDSNEFVPFEDLDWDSEGLEDMTENEDVTEGEDLEIE